MVSHQYRPERVEVHVRSIPFHGVLGSELTEVCLHNGVNLGDGEGVLICGGTEVLPAMSLEFGVNRRACRRGSGRGRGLGRGRSLGGGGGGSSRSLAGGGSGTGSSQALRVAARGYLEEIAKLV